MFNSYMEKDSWFQVFFHNYNFFKKQFGISVKCDIFTFLDLYQPAGSLQGHSKAPDIDQSI